ncbi:MAG: neutral zinc metallopeptidase [Actinomycetota bacterium]
MKWKRRGRSDDLIDRRGSSRGLGRGGGIPIPLGMLGKLGIPGLILMVIIVVISISGGTGIDGGVDSLQPGAGEPAADPLDPAEDPDAELVDFLSFVLDDIQDEWTELFRMSELEYERAELVVFDGATQSACGGAVEAVGPHYCPLDQRVYLDLSFFHELSQRYGARGDFAQAYVLAHEIGHHVQHLLGTMDRVRTAQQSSDDPNDLSIRLELQADCFAGIWGYSTFQRELLESGDLQEALNAASAVGDDRLQETATGRVNPETWTHGTSEQRMEWFRRGFDEGDPTSCDTFSGDV